jgi:predicted small integral membrane protein
MLRKTKILLIVTVALWGLVGAFGNIADWEGTTGAVRATTSMTTYDGGAESWRATSNPALIWVGALFITLSKLTAGLMCAIGAQRMWQARGSDATTFTAAKEIALAGCAIAMIMLFCGFIVVAESWYELWRSDIMRSASLETAFRYGGMIMLIAIFVGTKDE